MRAHGEQEWIIIEVVGPLERSDVPGFCERVRSSLLRSGADVVICDLSGLGPVDLVAVESLARMQLTARRAGGAIRLLQPCGVLQHLLALAGLTEALGLQLERQAEQREQGGGVEEGGDPDDLTLS